jgi:hypothetical protein
MPKPLYQFKYDNIKFSEIGLDRKIGLDRYSIQEMDPSKYQVNDLVLYRKNKNDNLQIGTIESFSLTDNLFTINDIITKESCVIRKNLILKPLEHSPQEWWTRWAEALVAQEDYDFAKWRNDYRWLFDGFKFSPGGRVMLALGEEYLNESPDVIEAYHRENRPIPSFKQKSNLTLFNCFVGSYPLGANKLWENFSKEKDYFKLLDSSFSQPITDKQLCLQQFLNVLNSNREEAEVMKHGGGYGMNASFINTVKSAGIKDDSIIIYVPNDHNVNIDELMDSKYLGKLGKYTKLETNSITIENLQDYVLIKLEDSLAGLFDGLEEMIIQSFNGNKIIIDFSQIRKRGEIIKKIKGRSSGVIAWAEVFEVWAMLLSQEYVDAVDFMETSSKIVHTIQQGGCVTGDTLIATNKGYITAKDLYYSTDESIMVLTHSGYRNITEKFFNGTKRMYQVTTKRGYSVKTSADHKYKIVAGFNNDLRRLEDVKVSDKTYILDPEEILGSNLGALTVDEIIEIKDVGDEDAYDFEVEDVHMLSFNGIYTSNSRRGALLILIESFRLDILDKFIQRKKEKDELNKGKWLTGSNISVGIDNQFMDIVKTVLSKRDFFFARMGLNKSDFANISELFELTPIEQERTMYSLRNKYFINSPTMFTANELHPLEKVIFKSWTNLIDASYSSAEPGIIWLEKYNHYSNSKYYNKIISCNPCATC